MASIYLIGSLRNPEVPKVAQALRADGHEVFDEWFSAGKIADDSWRDHQQRKGLTYQDALKGYAARHIFEFDRYHLNRTDVGILLTPAGRSAHLELGYMIGKGKLAYVLLGQPSPRWDVMLCFADGVFDDILPLLAALK